MLSAININLTNTLSNFIAEIYHNPPAILPTHAKSLNYLLSLWLICISLCNSTYVIASIETGEDDTIPITSLNENTNLKLNLNNHMMSSETFEFDDVYQIVLNADIPGDIKIVAIDDEEENNDTISVSLEKIVLNQDPSVSITYLENLTITGEKKEGILELKTQLPLEFSDSSIENPDDSNIKKLLQLNYAIKTPPDISVNLRIKNGDVFIHHLRGKIEITTETGNIHLDETLGNYQIEVQKGRVHGKILLAPGQNEIKSHNGSIDLTVLDDLSAAMEITAIGGEIRLLLPENYSADVELKNEIQHYIINIPAEIENNKGIINDGGPLLRLTSEDTISILRNPWLQKESEDTNEATPDEVPKNRFEQSIPFTQDPPKIDGKLTEAVWSNSVTLSAFQNPTGTEAAENPTDVHLMWDADYIYMGARVYLSTYQIPRVSQTQHDSPIWEDDSIEILIDMNPETEGYAHLVLNPIGGLYDQRVKKEGYPNFRFAPSDVERTPIDESVQKFQGDSKWQSKAKFATTINATFWSFEIAYPLHDGESNQEHDCLLNIHRKAIGISGELEEFDGTLLREFSYWLPMFDEEFPWWPHWKEGMGLLKLIKKQPSELSSLDINESFEVNKIEIIGNSKIPSGEIIKYLPISSGETITNEQLSWIIAELDLADVFEKILIETSVLEPLTSNTLSKKEPLKVKLQINVTEAPLQYAKRVIISGNKSFPSLFIRDWFDMSIGYLADENVKLKQRMIADFYVNRGYLFVEVTYEFEDDILQININEGHLDEIRFTGQHRISQSELASTLEIDTDRVFFETLAHTSINKMRDKLSKTNEHFKSVKDWHVQREGGRNVLIIDIEEQSIVKPGWYPLIGFNRVHGLILGAGGTLSTQLTGGEQVFSTVSGGFASKILNYSFGLEKSIFKTHPLTIGFGFFKLTDISSNAFRHFPVDPNLSAAAYGTDSADYYQRDGEQIWIAQRFGSQSLLRLEYTQEKHENLSKSTDWSYYDRNRVKSGNARIDRGHAKMLSLAYTFDTRDEKLTTKKPQFVGTHLILWPNERTRRGWSGNIGLEKAGGILGGDFTFNLYKFDLVRYTPFYGPHHVNIRLSGHFSDAPLPRQRLLYLGGATTLRGYDFNAYAGDKRILLNIEYRFIAETVINTNPNVILGVSIYTFLDTGQVWWNDENFLSDFDIDQLKTSTGIGVSFFLSPPDDFQPLSTAFEVAVPLNIESSFRLPRLIWRLERMF